MDNLCVICGATIPEGRQICPKCEKRRWDDEHDQGGRSDREVQDGTE